MPQDEKTRGGRRRRPVDIEEVSRRFVVAAGLRPYGQMFIGRRTRNFVQIFSTVIHRGCSRLATGLLFPATRGFSGGFTTVAADLRDRSERGRRFSMNHRRGR
jgi:hypothetical protein